VLPAAIAACVAANGVPLRDPLNPIAPALDQAITRPSASVIVTTVLLNDAWMWANPWCTTRFSPRFLNVFFFLPLSAAPSVFAITPSVQSNDAYSVFFRATAPRRGPLRVRALVRVRWPRAGRLRRCRDPR